VFTLILGLIMSIHIFACFWYATSATNIAQRYMLDIYTVVSGDGSAPSMEGRLDYETGEMVYTVDEKDVVCSQDGVTAYEHGQEDFGQAGFCGIPDIAPNANKRWFYDPETNQTHYKAATYGMAFHQATLMFMGESMDVQTDMERWMASILMLLGAIMMAWIFGEVSMYVTNFSASNNMFQKKMTDLYESMEALHLPQNLQERIHLFYKYVWDEHHSIDGRPAILTFVPELSTNLAKEIYLYLYSDMITKVPMFQNRPADVIQHLVLAVQVSRCTLRSQIRSPRPPPCMRSPRLLRARLTRAS